MRLPFEPRLLAASENPSLSISAYTFLFPFPTVKLAELRTHRIQCQSDALFEIGENDHFLSLNANSSRAIPIEKQLEMVRANPFVPIFTLNRAGMSGEIIPEGSKLDNLTCLWEIAADNARDLATRFQDEGVHKQDASLLINPFTWTICVATADHFAWEDFFRQRCDSSVYPAVRVIAEKLQNLYNKAVPKTLHAGGWHIPFIEQCPDEYLEVQLKVSASCTARISFANERHESIETHIDRYEKCRYAKPVPHGSVFEHQLRVPTEEELYNGDLNGRVFDPIKQTFTKGKYYSPVTGFIQLRKLIENDEF